MLRQARPLDIAPEIVPRVSIEPYDPADYNTSNVPHETVQGMVDNSYGDARVFTAQLNLYTFEQRERNGQLGPDEDPIQRYDQLKGDINQRLLDLHKANEIKLNEGQLKEIVGHQLGSAVVRDSVPRHHRLPTKYNLAA